ncbi:unnamed protein product [Allacma fusca]|uniref:Uncharacterized protein n=1 Tax=Allacma fusca TaxID=39272 RepID=A0A8J2P9K5_9HEXA|nr:unnamed protein product [Allacma fusca]
MGKTRVFLLNDIATWKEAYCRPELCRHPGRLFESVLENKGIVFGNATLTISSDSSIFGRGSILLLVPFISKIFQVQSRNELIKQTLLKFQELLQNRLQEYAASRRNSEIRGITDAFFDKVEQTDPNSNSFFARGDSLHLVYMGLLMSGVDSTSQSMLYTYRRKVSYGIWTQWSETETVFCDFTSKMFLEIPL